MSDFLYGDWTFIFHPIETISLQVNLYLFGFFHVFPQFSLMDIMCFHCFVYYFLFAGAKHWLLIWYCTVIYGLHICTFGQSFSAALYPTFSYTICLIVVYAAYVAYWVEQEFSNFCIIYVVYTFIRSYMGLFTQLCQADEMFLLYIYIKNIAASRAVIWAIFYALCMWTFITNFICVSNVQEPWWPHHHSCPTGQ